ncbi:protease complex subunit PrcB family protein [Flavobacterium pectinovorum]|uniref:Type IV secretion system putative lipoprotein virB7 n=1 Tax=Flavobacterium pectinovorum TaxID=29533 RepID=A0A502EFW3_9FLAO|nr:protease complex subunit PrcB family protein [Flavobacterium pectinovorum]TPG36337.1 protease complex subunit PrcB family protein [Flavobacterium pectinovorum]
MKQIITLFSILFLLTGCSNNDDSNSSEVKYSVILQGDHFNGDYNNPKANLVIKDQVEWNKLLLKFNFITNANVISPDLTVDFTKYQMIAVIDDVYNYGGYSIDITKIIETNSSIFVKVEYLKPGGINTVITQPYHIVKIPKTNKKVVFK